MKKLKSLILTMCFMIVVSTSNIYATNRAIHYQTTTSGTSSPPTASGKTELDGKIGEWDPNDSEKPDFSGIDSSDMEGTIPNSGDYYTISVTVPLEMNFMVLPYTQNPFGAFISPEYALKNNGSKTVTAKVRGMQQNTSSISVPQDELLYVDEKTPGDHKTQIELVLSAIDGQTRKDVNLYEFDTLTDDEKVLYDLRANEEKKIQFNSDAWELPNFEVGKDEVQSNFNLSLEFSISDDNPSNP